MSKTLVGRALFAVVVCVLLSRIAVNINRRLHPIKHPHAMSPGEDLVSRASADDYDGVLKRLNSGVPVDAVAPYGDTALLAAVKSATPDPRLVTLLLDRGAKVDGIDPMPSNRPLMAACYLGYRSLAQILIKRGANLNAVDRNYMETGGETALMYAMKSRDPKVVVLMLDAGADVSVGDSRQSNALMHAVQYHRLDLVRMLLNRRAVVASSAFYGRKGASRRAPAGGSSGTMYPAPADIDAGDHLGVTALMFAIEDHQIEIARELLKHGADVNARQHNGSTALQMAIYHGYIPCVKLLIAHHADVKTPCDFNGTPLNTALRVRRYGIVALLRQAGAVR